MKNNFILLIGLIFINLALFTFMISIGVSVNMGYLRSLEPLTVLVDENGQISFTLQVGKSAPLSLGDFPSKNISKPKEYFKTSNILEIRLNNRDYFFKLSKNNFKIGVESDCYEVVSLEKNAESFFIEFKQLNICKSSYAQLTTPTVQSTSTNLIATPTYPYVNQKTSDVAVAEISVIGIVISAILGVIGTSITAYATIQNVKINKVDKEKKKRK